MITFIVILITAVILAVIAEIILTRHRRAGTDVFDWHKEYPAFFQTVEDVKTAGSNLWAKRRKPDSKDAFRDWATKELGSEDKVLKEWLTTMSPAGLRALTQKLADFCAELNLDLRWLISDQIKLDPTLEQTMHEVVVSYCWACWKAVQVQSEIEVFKIFMAVTEDPAGKGQQDISQKLLSELRKHNLAPEPNPDWFLASESQRRDYLSQLIWQAAELDRTKFYTIFQEIISTNGTAAAGQTAKPSPTTSQPTTK